MPRRSSWRRAPKGKKKGFGGFRGGFVHWMFVPRGKSVAIMPMTEDSEGKPVEYKDPRPFFDGVKLPYYVYAKHRKDRGKEKGVYGVCNAGFKGTDDEYEANDTGDKDCVFCYLQEKGDKSIDRRIMAAWPVVHLAPYHNVQATDRNKEPIFYSKGKNKGQPIMERRECEGKGCEHCANDEELVAFSSRYIELSPNFVDQIRNIDADLSRACANCREGDIEVTALVCEDCGKSLVDMTNVGEEEYESLMQGELTCKKCGHRGVPLEDVECSNCEDAKPTSFADVVLFLTKTGEGTSSAMALKHPKNPSKPGWMYRDDFEYEGEQVAWFDTDEDEAEGKFTYVDEVKDLLNPFDFSHMIGTGPEDLSNQAKRLQVSNPFDGGGGDNDDDGDGDDPPQRRSRSRRSGRRAQY